MRPHQRLEAWIKAIELVVDVYKRTERFPKEERYGLTSQMRRGSFYSREHCRRSWKTLEKGVWLLPVKLPGIGQRA